MNLDFVDEDMAGITSSPMNLDSDQNEFRDLNHNLSDTPPLPAGLATPQRHGWVATVLKQAQLASSSMTKSTIRKLTHFCLSWHYGQPELRVKVACGDE